MVLISLGLMTLVVGKDHVSARGAIYALSAGALIAGYSLLGGIGVRMSGTAIGFAAWLHVIAGIGVIAVVLAVRHRSDQILGTIGVGMVAGIVSVGGFVVSLWAMTLVPIAKVTAIRESSVIFAALLGVFVLREPVGLKRGLAAALVSAGVAALSLL